MYIRPIGFYIDAKNGGRDMDSTSAATNPAASPVSQIIAIAKAVITDPRSFFRAMPRTGGFVEPLIFVAGMSIVTSIVAIPLWLIGVGPYGAFPGLIFSFVIAPIMSVVGSFVGAAVVFVIWRLLGSTQPYEVAYRCLAYMNALSPIAVVAALVPYLGPLALLAWGFVLIVIASEEVHGIERQKARLVFGVIGVLFALMSISSQRAANVMQDRTDELTEQLDNLDDMSPEEAGKAVGEFMKGLQGAIDEKPADDGTE